MGHHADFEIWARQQQNDIRTRDVCGQTQGGQNSFQEKLIGGGEGSNVLLPESHIDLEVVVVARNRH
jgi:hypothetical protein